MIEKNLWLRKCDDDWEIFFMHALIWWSLKTGVKSSIMVKGVGFGGTKSQVQQLCGLGESWLAAADLFPLS